MGERSRTRAAGVAGGGEAYYYASGERVALERAEDLVAVDTAALEAAGLAAEVRELNAAGARPLRGHYVLLETRSLSAEMLARLREARATQPVYRAGGALVVVMPEVRVEETRPGRIERLRAWLHGARGAVEASELARGRLTLRPTSGSGEDALRIANELHERVGLEMAQARFVRIVRRPDVSRAKRKR